MSAMVPPMAPMSAITHEVPPGGSDGMNPRLAAGQSGESKNAVSNTIARRDTTEQY